MNYNKLFLSVSILLFCVTTIFSCDFSTGETTNSSYVMTSLTGNTDPTDGQITRSIDTEFFVQDGVDANHVDIETSEGIVTLTGEVDNLLAKNRAVKIAKEVKGVRGVVDKLTVVSYAISDESLKEQVKRALLYDPATDSYEVDVEVQMGAVTITGDVESWQERELASKVVQSVKGVRSVSNEIDYTLVTNRPDYEIQQDIEQALRWDIRVDDGLIDVAVRNGEVTLSGIVGSASEKDQAEINSWTNGVKEVNSENVSVQRWARDEDLRKDKYHDITDTEIRDAVNDALLYDPRVYSFNPDVEVENGKVTLTGVVDNLKAKRAAGIDAKNVVGVWSVVNQLKVRGYDYPADSTVRENVINAIDWNPYLEVYEITVSAVDGVVHLNGLVDSYFEKYEAGDIAATAYGVTNVKNNLRVSPRATPYVFDYEYQYYYPYGYIDDYNYSPVKTDLSILNDINDQIWWSPYVDSSDVEVTVEDGVAVLTGTVESWKEYYRAEKNAFEGGALIVDNNLEVSS